MAHRLERLLRPKSLAVFGGEQARRVIEQCDRMGFSGDIWPLHPRHEWVAGRRCYRSIEELPGVPDATFIGVNRHQTIRIVRDLSAAGAGGAVCYASGFLESVVESSDAEGLQESLLEAAAEMPVLGPNCYGVINYLDGALLWPDQHGGQGLAPDAKGVAIISQSSNIALNITMQQRGLPIAYVVTAGNQAQVSLAEIASGLFDDARVSAIGIHIEGFGDIRAFEAMAAKARELKIPIVVLKVGRSLQSQAATLSHTASLAGSDAGSGAFLRRLGIPRVESIPVLLESLKLLHVHGPLPGFDIASLSCSGGEACLMADAIIGTRLRYGSLSDSVQKNIKALVGPLVKAVNPLDYHTFIWGNEDAMTKTFSAMLANGFDLAILVMDLPRADLCDDQEWWVAIESFATALQQMGCRGAVLSSMTENLSEACAQRLLGLGIVPFAGIVEAVAAIQSAAEVAVAWNNRAPVPIALIAQTQQEGAILDEYQAKLILAENNIPTVEHIKAMSISGAVAAARKLKFPVVVKSLGLAHKTEHGGIRLNLKNLTEVRRAAKELLPLGQGVLVERMVLGSVAELLVGVHRDPPFGLVLSIGAGGELTELLDDSVQLLLPVSEDEVRQGLSCLRIEPQLKGYRGRPQADTDALVKSILALAVFCEGNADKVLELDINPFIVRAEGAGVVAVDALMVMSKNT